MTDIKQEAQPPRHTVASFCEELRKSVEDHGMGVVPLVGAGLSINAGIPTGDELLLYLKLCISMALGLDGDDAGPDGNTWNPREAEWPAMEGDWVLRAIRGERRLNDIIHLSFETPDNGRMRHFKSICRQAYGALSDWRQALQFLARIREPSVADPDIPIGPRFQPNLIFTALNRIGDSGSAILEALKIAKDVQAGPASEETSHSEATKEIAVTESETAPQPPYRSSLELAKAVASVQALLDEASKAYRFSTLDEALHYARRRLDEQNTLVKALNGQILERRPPSLGDIDGNVIDSFFNHLVRDAKPTMEHRILSRFAHPLRARVILTLNFDDLLEQAFREQEIDPVVITVHQAATIPPATLLGNEYTVIKLHGGRYGLRADFSLDRTPTAQDISHFAGYFRSLSGESAQEVSAARNCLLVAGVSGQDRHIRLLIRATLTQLDRNFKVFWCCFSQNDERNVTEFFPGEILSGRLVLVRTNHLGMLLWEIFGRVTRSLPSGGIRYPSTWTGASPPPISLREEEIFRSASWQGLYKAAQRWFNERRANTFRQYSRSPDSANNALFIRHFDGGHLKSTPSCWGCIQFAWKLYEDWFPAHRCVWLDGEDIATSSDLKSRLLQAMHNSIARVSSQPSILQPISDEAFLLLFIDALQMSGRPWAIFLNFRGSLGYNCAPFSEMMDCPVCEETKENQGIYFAKRTHLWNVDSTRYADISSTLLTLLGLTNSIEPWQKAILRRLVNLVVLDRDGMFDEVQKAGRYDVLRSTEALESDWATNRTNAAKQWILGAGKTPNPNAAAQARLLYAIVLLRDACHHSALVSRAVMDNPNVRTSREQYWRKSWREVERDLNELERLDILRRRVGGFIWMHWEVREHLTQLLLTDDDIKAIQHPVGDRVKTRPFPQSLASQLHLGIADWLLIFFYATRDPLAILKAIHHRCWVARLGFIESEDEHREVVARGALCEVNNHFEIARASILSGNSSLDVERGLADYFDKCLCLLLAEQQTAFLHSQSHSEKEAAQRNLRLIIMVKMKALRLSLWYHRDAGNLNEVSRRLRHYYYSWLKDWADAERGGLLVLYTREWADEATWSATFVAFEAALLAIGTRSYSLAEKRLLTIAKNVAFPTNVSAMERDYEVWEAVNRWIQNTANPELDKQRYLSRKVMIYVLRRLMELELLRAELEQDLCDAIRHRSLNTARRETALYKAERYYIAVQALPRYVTDDEYSLLRVERSRVHSIMAGIVSLTGDYQGVHRQLNEARVVLGHLPESEAALATTVLELRRIYCKMAELRSLSKLSDFVNDEDKRAYMVNEIALEKEMDRADGLLGDISLALSRLHNRMENGRKSLWWWMTLCRYKMVWHEYSLAVAIWKEMRSPRRASPSNTGMRHLRDAARVLHDACRHSKFDELQLARVIHSFLNIESMQDSTKVGFEAINVACQSMSQLEERAASHAACNCGDDAGCECKSLWTLEPEVATLVRAVKFRAGERKDRLAALFQISIAPMLP